MRNILGIVLLGCVWGTFAMEADSSIGAPKSLNHQCMNAIFKNARKFLNEDSEHRLPLDLHDIGKCWYSGLSKIHDSWWKQLVWSNNSTKILGNDVVEIQFDAHQPVIKIEIINDLRSGMLMRKTTNVKYLDFEGKEDIDFTHIYFTQAEPEVLTNEAEIEYGLKNFWFALRSTKHKKVISVVKMVANLHDYAPGEAFKEYVSHAPLAHILLFEIFRATHEEGEKIFLTAFEAEVLNGMPPVFEKAKQFLMESVES